MKKTIQECIFEAIGNNDGKASLQEIYRYTSEQIKASNVESTDYKHTVRGLLNRLVKQGKLTRNYKTQFYELPTHENTKFPRF